MKWFKVIAVACASYCWPVFLSTSIQKLIGVNGQPSWSETMPLLWVPLVVIAVLATIDGVFSGSN